MSDFFRDIRYAIRRLSSSPLFTTAALLTLAAAIGATGSVYGLVDAVLFKSYSVRDPNRVIAIWESSTVRNLPQFAVAAGNYQTWRTENTTFVDVAASSSQLFTLLGTEEPVRARGAEVTPNFFSVLGLAPLLGRVLSSEASASPEVLLSEGLWRRDFAADPKIVGRTLIVNDRPHVVVGVLPRGSPGTSELWTRLEFTAADLNERGQRSLVVIGRLKEHVTIARAESDLKTIAHRLAVSYPETNDGWSVRLVPLLDQLLGKVRPALAMLMLVATSVLLIGAANLANLFLVRGLAREHDLAVRFALGATRPRIIRELVVEAGTLGLTAGVLGMVLAILGVRVLAMLAPASLPGLSDVQADGSIVIFCILAAIATVLFFGLLPAFQVSQGGLASLLKDGRRASGNRKRHQALDGLVVLQVVVTLVLTIGAALLSDAFVRLRHLDPGFSSSRVLTAAIDLPSQSDSSPERQDLFVSSVLEQVKAQPGIQRASASSSIPGGGAGYWAFNIVGSPPSDPSQAPVANVVMASPEYFATLSIKVQQGRAFLPSDDRQGRKVCVIDQLLVRQFMKNRDPLGVRLVPVHDSSAVMEVVGVVSSVKQWGLTAADVPTIYVPYSQFPNPSIMLAVRTSSDPRLQVATLKHAVAQVNRSVPVSDVRTMDERMAQSVETMRFATLLASIFAGVAIVLGAVGIYSILAYTVGQRQRDIAIRLALGAQRSTVMYSVLRRAFKLTLAGLVVGSVAAWILSRSMAEAFPGVRPHDPVVFGVAAIFLTGVALAAASVPALRATRVDPLLTLNAS